MKTNFLSLKNIFLVKHWWLVLLTLNFNIFSQTSPPESISYQGVARDASGNILSNQPIGIQFLIHQGSLSGTVVFYETHSTSTNAVGIFTLAIGSVNTSTFQSIPWNNGPYFLEVLMDPTGGSSYTSIGTQQLLSVPYALYAKSSYTAAGSFSSAISYSTNNAPPISINSSTSANSTTLTFTQGSNSSSVVINYPSSNITMVPSGIASVTPNSGTTFTVDVPPPTLNVTSGTNDATISISQGSVTTTQTLSFPPTNINGIGTGIASTTISGNSFTVDVPPPSLSIASGASDATITITQGTAITTQTLSFPPASVPNVSINATGIVTVTPTSGTAFTIGAPTPTITSGTGISVSGTYPNIIITNTAPDQTVNLNAGTNVTVTGTYPTFNISSAPTLSLAGNTLSISGGNAVTLPASNVTITGVSPVVVTPTTGSVFNLSLTSQTLSLMGNGSSSSYSLSSNYGGLVALPKPTLSINAPHGAASSPGGYSTNFNIVPPTILPSTSSTANIASVSSNTSSLQYTVNVPPPALSITNGVGQSTLSLSQGPVTTTALINTGAPNEWHLTGNAGTNPSAHFIGTSDAQDFVFRTSNTERMRIGSNGNIGIGTTAPLYPLHTVYSGTNSNVHYIDYTSTASSGANSAIYTNAKSTGGGNIFGGYFQVSGSNTSSSATAVKGFATSSASYNYGIEASAIGTTTNTNYGGSFYAANGTNNYGIYTEVYSNNASFNNAAIYALSSGNNGVAGRFIITNSTNTSPVLEVTNYSSGGNLAIFSGNGYVGIGTTAPQSYLHVVTPSSASTNVFQIGNGNQPSFEWLFDVDGLSNLTIKNESNGFPYLSMTGNNIVGVNTTTPIGSADFIVSYNSNHTTGYAGMYVNSATGGWPFYGYAKGGSAIAWSYLDNANTWILNNGGANRIAVTTAGNMGIGTLSPSSKLSVVGNIDIPPTNSYKYTSPKTYTLNIHPSSFNPENSTVSYTLGPGGVMGPAPVGTGTLSTGLTCYYETPLLLPYNCTITAIYANVIDNDASYNISQIQIFKSDFAVGTPFGNITLIGTSLGTGGVNPNFQQLNSSLSEIYNNTNYSYYIRVGMSYPGPTAATIKLGKILIIYQVLETD